MVVISLLDRVIPLEYPRFRVLLGAAGATVSLQGLIFLCQLSQSLMLARLWLLRDHCKNHALVNKLMRVQRRDIQVVKKTGNDSLKTLQEIEHSEKKKQSKMWKWSREGRQNPNLPAAGDNDGYVLTEEILELALFAKVFATRPDDPLSNRYCLYCMPCNRNIPMRLHGLYELKCHFEQDCLFRADQRLRAKICPGETRCRDGRLLYGSKMATERELYMELKFPDLSHKRPFYYDVLEGKPILLLLLIC